MRGANELLAVAAVAGLVFFTGLGGTRLWDRDETRNAGCAVEMLRGGDWVTPVFNAELRTHKPVLTYWFMMLSYAALGVTEFSARLPSAVLGVGTCLLTCLMGRRLFGGAAGVWSGIILASTLMFGVASRAATPDAPLIFFSTLSLAIYVWGITQPARSDDPSASERLSPPPFLGRGPGGGWTEGRLTATGDSAGIKRLFPEHWSTTALMYAAMGVAVLAKGPVGLVLPTAVIGMFLLIGRLPGSGPAATWRAQLLRVIQPFAPMHFLKTCWAMRPVTAVLVAAAVALPWYVWVHARTDGAWTEGFFFTHNLSRAMNSMEGHRGNLLFYPVALIVGFFPWSILWLPVISSAVRRVRDGHVEPRGELLALCWMGVWLGLFSLARTKLPSYITPCYPGMALLTGAWVARLLSGELTFAPLWRRLAFGSLAFVGMCVAIALPLLSAQFLPGEELLGLAGIIPLAGGLAALLFAEWSRPRRTMAALAVTSIAFSLSLHAVVADRIDRHRPIEQMVAAIYGAGGANIDAVEVGTLASPEASWVFYCRQPIALLSSPREALDYLNTESTGKRRVLLVTDRQLQDWSADLPLSGFQQQSVPLFLEDERLVVLTPHDPILKTASGQGDEATH